MADMSSGWVVQEGTHVWLLSPDQQIPAGAWGR
jgi:hypothetical protein